MPITPSREDRDLKARRKSLVEREFPQMGLVPWDDEVTRWMERSRSRLHDDIAEMHRNLFSLEVS